MDLQEQQHELRKGEIPSHIRERLQKPEVSLDEGRGRGGQNIIIKLVFGCVIVIHRNTFLYLTLC